MTIGTSDDESPISSFRMPGSPPDLSLSSSKSSKSSFHSYQSDDNAILADAAHFEDIGLDDDVKSEQESGDFVHELPFTTSYSTDRLAKGRSKSLAPVRRDLTSAKARPGLPGAKGHARKPTGEVHGLGLTPASAGSRPTPRRSASAQSMTTLSTMSLRNRSPSPAISPHSLYPKSPLSRRASWQANRERKTAEELEQECDEEDGDDIPDECFLENVPISPRPPTERAVSMPPTWPEPKKEKRKAKPAGNGTPPTPVAQGSLKQPNGAPKLGSPTHHKPPRAKSWTAALSELSAEAQALTEALEAHADEQGEPIAPRRQRNSTSPTDKKRSRSVMSELPPLRRNDVMIDPLPISKEKLAVLSRTRPSWLPPKDPLEEKRHLKEYQRMMAASKDAEAKRAASTQTRNTCRDDTASSLLRIWEDHVLPNWDAATSLKRTRELWWRGIAPRSRGAVWERAIGNELGLADASYGAALRRARDVEKKLARGGGSAEDLRKGKWFAAIQADVATTYPDLRIFLPGGPLSETLVDVLMAYVVYRSDVGYVAGLSTTAALLLLNLPTPPSAFRALANLLNRPLPLSFHTHDAGATSRIHALVLSTLAAKQPRLHAHLCAVARLQEQPGALLDPVFAALFSRQLGLDALTRLWDVWVFEGDAVLVRAMVALLAVREGRLCAAGGVAEVGVVLGEGGVLGEEEWVRALREAGR